jgi:hypothetical protein
MPVGERVATLIAQGMPDRRRLRRTARPDRTGQTNVSITTKTSLEAAPLFNQCVAAQYRFTDGPGGKILLVLFLFSC